jgi:phosphomannomutase
VRDLSRIVKAYDVRGIVPDELDETVATALGAAFADVVGVPGVPVVVGRDMRASSRPLADAFAAGVTSRGLDVLDIGLASTDGVYFASGRFDAPGAMFTASHNPARYNGVKLCRPGAAPVGQDTGLADIRARAEAALSEWELSGAPPLPTGRTGSVEAVDVLPEYAAHLRTLADVSALRPLRVVVDAGNGMAGLTVPAVFAGLPLTVMALYFELDGTFPNHEPNPIDPENLKDLSAAVLAHDADLGLAFDGDADRCFVVDELGVPVSPSALCGLIATRELARDPGAAVVHNLITSQAVPQIVAEHGGRPVRTRVGHSFIKAVMAETGAVFGGEHSGHFYFRDFWYADSGMLAALHVLAALGNEPAGTGLSTLLKAFQRYSESGEINSTVGDPAASLAAVRQAWAGRDGVRVDSLDGLSVSVPGDSGDPDAWFNVRPSNTEPLLRLNVEAVDQIRMAAVRDEVLAMIRA